MKRKASLSSKVARVFGLRQVNVADRQYARRIAANVAKLPGLRELRQDEPGNPTAIRLTKNEVQVVSTRG